MLGMWRLKASPRRTDSFFFFNRVNKDTELWHANVTNIKFATPLFNLSAQLTLLRLIRALVHQNRAPLLTLLTLTLNKVIDVHDYNFPSSTAQTSRKWEQQTWIQYNYSDECPIINPMNVPQSMRACDVLS